MSLINTSQNNKIQFNSSKMGNLQKYLKVNISQNFINLQETAETGEKTTIERL